MNLKKCFFFLQFVAGVFVTEFTEVDLCKVCYVCVKRNFCFSESIGFRCRNGEERVNCETIFEVVSKNKDTTIEAVLITYRHMPRQREVFCGAY